MRTLTAKTPIFFKGLPRTEDTPTNAEYIRPLGGLPNGTPVHEIRYRGERWTAGDSDFHTQAEALAKTAANYQAEIDRVKKPGMKLEEIAAALCVSVGTLKKRMGMIRNHLTKESAY